jgi:hypothetical protein
VLSSYSYCLHQLRVCLSLSRLTDDVTIRQRCEELAMDFAARIGGKDDFDIVELRGDQQGTRRHLSVENSKAVGGVSMPTALP